MCETWTQEQWITNAGIIKNAEGQLKYSVEQLFNTAGERALIIHESGSNVHWLTKRSDGRDAFFTDNCDTVDEYLSGYSQKRNTTVAEVLETIGNLTEDEQKTVAKSADLTRLLANFR